MNFENTFKNEKVLITGHTGFKGAWLSLWLTNLGAKVTGVSVDIPTVPSHFLASELSSKVEDIRLDVVDGARLKEVIRNLQPKFIFHLAAQALVKTSYQNPVNTWQTNTMGTINLLEALRYSDHPCRAVIITSDKSYENVEWVWGYRETDRLGGGDPYSASKAGAEIAIKSYVKSYFPAGGMVRVGVARAGNVIGGGDWAPDRIVPDCVAAWSRDDFVNLRNPNSTRPWQHVLEPLSGYLLLGAALDRNDDLQGEAFNFGPAAEQNYSVGELVTKMSQYWEKVRWADVSGGVAGPSEAGLLKLNCDKALHYLNWLPVWGFEETIKETINWYRTYYKNPEKTMCDYSLNQIEQYSLKAKMKGLPWAQ